MQDNNITILIKLFDTLKETSIRNEESTQKLIMQQLELVGQIKSLPVEDLKQALKEHARDSADNIDDCSGIIELKTADIMDMLRTVINKLNRLMLVVGVVVTVATIAYFTIKTVSDNNAAERAQKYEQVLPADQFDIMEDIKHILENHLQEGESDSSEEKE